MKPGISWVSDTLTDPQQQSPRVHSPGAARLELRPLYRSFAGTTMGERWEAQLLTRQTGTVMNEWAAAQSRSDPSTPVLPLQLSEPTKHSSIRQ